ncbi:MAG: L-threonylcarbamoyladenylate synthase [Rugosibacter sp.]|nr:L-threonylcarbamoyladenylate synthase [Rugosibacter sp.]
MNDIARAAALLRAGELVALPTETVYGLGADARNPAALAKIFAAKGRPADHPLIVHLPDASHLPQWATDIPASAYQLAQAFWPGPLTLILKRHPDVPDLVTGGQDTIGVRVPDHPVALALLREFGSGIAAPSANKFGRISPTTAAHVEEELGGNTEHPVAMILDGGACRVGIESTILDLTSATPRILRPGALSAATLSAILRRPLQDSTQPGDEGSEASHNGRTGKTAHKSAQEKTGGEPNLPRVSGSLSAHYAPRTPLKIVPMDGLSAAVNTRLQLGQRVAALATTDNLPAHPQLVCRVASADFSQFAQSLYANLRALDAANCDVILVAHPPNDPAWLAATDRLMRAAAGSKG